MGKNAVIAGFSGLLIACGPADPGEGAGDTEQGSSGSDAVTTAGTTSAGPSSSSASESASGSSSGQDTTGSATTGPELPPPTDLEINWVPCPVFTGAGGDEAQCSTVEVPADWNNPDGDTIEVFVKRVGAMQGDKQLWMLMGGPGGSARGYESSADLYTSNDDGLTVYLLDHRGTGRSTMLACPEQEAPGTAGDRAIRSSEATACAEYLMATHGDTLPFFSTDGASHDLGQLIEEVRGDEAVHIFGGSYGTYWAQRYLQWYPDQPDGVTMVGITHPTFTFTNWAEEYNAVGEAILADCGDDAYCSSRLGPDPAATMEAVNDLLDNGHCPQAQAAGISRDVLRQYFSSLLSWAGDERARIPAVIYRLQRCSDEDIAALTNAGPQMQNPLAGLIDDPYFSVVMNHHVKYSEIWEAPFRTVEELQALEPDLLFLLGSGVETTLVEPLWPTYPEPPLDDQFAETDVPMLMMTGEYDPNSPAAQAEAVGDHYDGPNQHYFTIPDGNHGMYSPTTMGWGCAENIFWGFLQDPTAPPLDCIGIIEPIDWAGSPGDAQAFFGTQDLYD